jgi:hypothetical protein
MSAHPITDEMRVRAHDLAGLFAGQCTPDEYQDLIAAGLLRRSYAGAAGLLGMAKFELGEVA